MKKRKILFASWILLYLAISFHGVGLSSAKPGVDNLLGKYDFKPFSFLYYFFARMPYINTFSGTVKEFVRSTKDFFFNIILFIPFGIIFEKSFKKTVLYGILIACSVELIQLAFGFLGMANRVCDINDVVSAFFGVVLGYFARNKIVCRKKEKNAF